MSEVSKSALNDVSDVKTDTYIYLLENGKYSPYDEATREIIAKYIV